MVIPIPIFTTFLPKSDTIENLNFLDFLLLCDSFHLRKDIHSILFCRGRNKPTQTLTCSLVFCLNEKDLVSVSHITFLFNILKIRKIPELTKNSQELLKIKEQL